MICYFSGTGNSLWTAQELSKRLNEPLVAIAEALKSDKKELHYQLSEEERVIFVFPVHSWGPAVPIARFIRRMRWDNYHKQPVYAVMTCGDEAGLTHAILEKQLHRKGITLTASYTLQMPNNYILMKGFDVDNKEVEERKLKEAPRLLQEIVASITGADQKPLYHTGKSAWLKSRIVYPLFTGMAIKKNDFYAMDICNSCGKCAKVCPLGIIRMEEGRPEWSSGCVQCLACIHHCPIRAIEYGKQTWNKGRYLHPGK